MPKRSRSARSPSADNMSSSSAVTTSVADQRAATIRTARMLCRCVAVLCLAQALREDGARAEVMNSLQEVDVHKLAANHACRILAILLFGELSGWWVPTRLVGLQNFRNSPLFELMFSGAAKKLVWRAAYFVMSYFYRNEEWTCMNYGYATDNELLGSLEKDKEERYPLQMYRRLISSLPIDLEGQRILEVGSGRGGGLAHLAKTQADAGQPFSEAVGGDLCSQQIALCSQRFEGYVDGLSYVQADAENLPFDDESFDAIINVESSHCYPHIDSFLSEVSRVLAPGGCFGIVDFRKIDDGKMAAFEDKLDSLDGMKMITNVDITPNVIKACERDHERRLALIDGNVHTPLKKAFLNFAGVADGQSGIFTDFVRGTYQYRLWVLQKSG